MNVGGKSSGHAEHQQSHASMESLQKRLLQGGEESYGGRVRAAVRHGADAG